MKKLTTLLLSVASVFCFSGCSNRAASIGVIGGADGPTAVFVSSGIGWSHVVLLLGIVIIAVVAALIIHHRRKNK